MIRVSIIIPVFNGLEFTIKCLDSLTTETRQVNSNHIIFSIVVVDDGSSDGTSDWIETHYSNVHLLKGDGNLWWSGGINVGIKYSLNVLKCDYTIWWNNDIKSGKDYFKLVADKLLQDSSIPILGSKIFKAQEPNVVWSMGGLFNPETGFKSMIGSEQVDDVIFRNITECDWLPGMGTIIQKSVYDKIGFLDEDNFPQYHGDSDFTFRAKTVGFKICVDPTLILYNDTRHSGIKHDESFKKLFQSLFSIRSNFNISKDFKFYRIHSKSWKSFHVPIKKYLKYIGGFFKWKIASIIGLKRK